MLFAYSSALFVIPSVLWKIEFRCVYLFSRHEMFECFLPIESTLKDMFFRFVIVFILFHVLFLFSEGRHLQNLVWPNRQFVGRPSGRHSVSWIVNVYRLFKLCWKEWITSSHHTLLLAGKGYHFSNDGSVGRVDWTLHLLCWPMLVSFFPSLVGGLQLTVHFSPFLIELFW